MREVDEYDVFYKGGYHDGLSDALNAIDREGSGVDARRDIMRLMGWGSCPSCGGDGTNHQPTEVDLAVGLLRSSGARTSADPLSCRRCDGEGLVRPSQSKAAL